MPIEQAAAGFLALLAFALGGTIGSFLNVVVYRLPRRQSLSDPPSRCPKCEHPIRWHDNVPVLGWLLLGGRCRDCRASISPRYPAVEATVAILFLGLALLEFGTRGANLPVRPVLVDDGVLFPRRGLGEIGAIWAYHLLLLCTLLPAALIELDRLASPWRLFGPALTVGLLGPLFAPHLHPVPAWPDLSGPGGVFVGSAIGIAAGLAAGSVFLLGAAGHQRRGALLGSAAVGLFFGWQAAVIVVLVAAVCFLLGALAAALLPTSNRVPPTAWLMLASLIWITIWRPLVLHVPPLG
jgi:leader peptidase (prepilin peptidase)/N-methyltransferase